jgi:hypothetical protein
MATAKKVTKKKVAKKAATKKTATVKGSAASSEEAIVIPPMKMKTAKITIQGISPLMVHNFDEKSARQMSEAYLNKANKKATNNDTKVRTAQEDFEAALYYMPGHTKRSPKYGIPAAGIKKAAVTAAMRFVQGVKGTHVKGAFFVVEEGNGLVPIKSKKGPVPDERIVRVGNFGNKKPALRTRPRFDDWECTFTVQYRADLISAEQLLNLFENAGFSVGLCEYRPENDGNLGMFKVKRA